MAQTSAGGAAAGDGLEPVLVVIPTYNEVDNLPGTVRRLRDSVPGAEVLVVDDASPDGTGALADRLAGVDGRLHVLHRASKAGLGSAYSAGFAWGLQRGYQTFVEMDADGSHHPEELPTLLRALSGADLVIGSRWVRGGRVENWPRRRELLSRTANLYTRLVLGAPVRDCTGGFRAFRRRTLEGVDLVNVASQGYCFQIDLTWRTLQGGFQVVEVPITFSERRRGVSKMSRYIVAEALLRVTSWGLRRRVAAVRRLGTSLRPGPALPPGPRRPRRRRTAP